MFSNEHEQEPREEADGGEVRRGVHGGMSASRSQQHQCCYVICRGCPDWVSEMVCLESNPSTLTTTTPILHVTPLL